MYETMTARFFVRFSCKLSQTTNVAKMVSESWKNLSAEEREYWDEKARSDKERFELEKRLYDGPWKVLAQKTSKDPNAPKRPMSAFLAYSNSKRSAVKRENSGLTNAEVSRVLASMWKCADEEEKRFYIEEEYKLRQNYKTRIAEWRANEEKEKEVQKMMREELSLRTIEAHRRQLEDENCGEAMRRHTDNLPLLQVAPHLAVLQDGRDRGDFGRIPVPSHHRDEIMEHHHMNSMDHHLGQPMQGGMIPSYATYNHDSSLSSILGSPGFNTAQSLYGKVLAPKVIGATFTILLQNSFERMNLTPHPFVTTDQQQTLISNLQQHQHQQWGSNGYNSRNTALLNAFTAQNLGTGHRYVPGRYPDEYHQHGGREGDFNNNFFDQPGPY
jgi:HMG (high mobility group) box